jgi:hypothetical protein
VDINHPMAETGDHRPGDFLEVAGEDDEPRARRFQGGLEFGGIGGIREDMSGNARPAGALEGARIGAVRDDQDDPGRGLPGEGVEQRLQVRAAARDQDGDPDRLAQRKRLCSQRADDRSREPRVTSRE